jgi:hypothetical protein
MVEFEGYRYIEGNQVFEITCGTGSGLCRATIVEDGSGADVPYQRVAVGAEEYTITDEWRIQSVKRVTLSDLLFGVEVPELWTIITEELCRGVVAGEIALHETSIVEEMLPRPFLGTSVLHPLKPRTRVYSSSLHPFWLVAVDFDRELRLSCVGFNLPRPLDLTLNEGDAFEPQKKEVDSAVMARTFLQVDLTYPMGDIRGMGMWDWLRLWHTHVAQLDFISRGWPHAASLYKYHDAHDDHHDPMIAVATEVCVI